MKINKLLLERIVKEEVSSLRKEYKLLENNIKIHEATLKEAWWDTLKRGVKKLTSSDLEDMATETETKQAVAKTAEFMKKIKELEDYETKIETLKVTDVEKMKSELTDYVTTFKEALDEYNETEESKKSAKFPYLQSAFASARSVLGRIVDTVSAASEQLGKMVSGTDFAQPTQIPPAPTGAPSKASPRRSVSGGRTSPTRPTVGGLAGGVLQENKRKSRITKK